jgi:hypothetical protein
VKKKHVIVISASLLLAIIAIGFCVQPQLFPRLLESSYEKEVRSLFNKVQTDVSKLRGFSPPKDVKLEIVSIEFFKSDTKENLEKSDLLKAQEALYKSLLIVPKNFSLLDKKVSEAGRTLAASSGITLYVVKEYFDPTDRRQALRTLAHEYTHILQFVHLPQKSIRTEDELRAWTAFIEGEADLVADLYISKEMNENFSPRIPPSPTSKSHDASDGWVLDQIFAFPYLYGENFVYQLFQNGGWEEVNRAYHHVPSSTADILHPIRYLNGSEPSVPSNPLPVRQGWSLYYPERLGEYFIRTTLLQELPPSSVVNASADWVGDNSTLYLNDNTYLLFWKSIWKDEYSASNIEEIILDLIKAKGGIELNDIFWDIDGRLIAMKCVGQTVTLIGSSDINILMEEVESEFGSHS